VKSHISATFGSLASSVLAATLAIGGCAGSDNAPAGVGSSGSSGQTSDGGPSGSGGNGGASSGALALTSTVFHDGETIAQEYRCVAPSPDLAWSAGPSDARSYAIVMQDVTPGISNGALHWVLFDIPSTVHSLPEGVPVGYAPAEPAGAHQAPIWNGTPGFNGPCGGNNTYELTLHALDVASLPGIDETSAGRAAVTAIESHSTASVTMTVLSHP
jgi:Raf kinase inhibitor-like YbhB/YbcL family protein